MSFIVLVSVSDDSIQQFEIRLDQVTLKELDTLSLKPSEQAMVADLLANDSLALVDYWSVDLNPDGDVHQSVWQSYRKSSSKLVDCHPVANVARVDRPIGDAELGLGIRVLDVFGHEFQTIYHL